MPKGFRNDRNFPVLREYKARHDMRELLRRHGAHAVGIGPKISDGEETDKSALVFYVSAKRERPMISTSVRRSRRASTS